MTASYSLNGPHQAISQKHKSNTYSAKSSIYTIYMIPYKLMILHYMYQTFYVFVKWPDDGH